MGTWGSFLGVKRLGREADHSLSFSAEVENAWSYTSAPHYAFMTLRSIKKGRGTTLPLPDLSIQINYLVSPSLHYLGSMTSISSKMTSY